MIRATTRLMKVLFTLAFTICFLTGYSQKWDKGFAKADIAYENGDYKKAQKFNLKIKKKASKKKKAKTSTRSAKNTAAGSKKKS